MRVVRESGLGVPESCVSTLVLTDRFSPIHVFASLYPHSLVC